MTALAVTTKHEMQASGIAREGVRQIKIVSVLTVPRSQKINLTWKPRGTTNCRRHRLWASAREGESQPERLPPAHAGRKHFQTGQGQVEKPAPTGMGQRRACRA